MGIANISGNLLTDSGTNLSSLVSGSGTTNYLPKFTGASTIGNSQIQDDGTSVGIGGSPNASYKLAVTGAGLYTGNLNINGETLTIGGTTNNAIINNIASIRVNIDCDNTGTGESFTIGHNQTAINDSNVLFRVQDNGNVGIGTSSPSEILEVNHPSNSGSTKKYVFKGYDNTGNINGIALRVYDTAGGVSFADVGADYYGTGSDTNLTFSTRSAGSALTERMRIQADGRINSTMATNNTNTHYIIHSGTSPFGINITYSGASPNSTGNNFIYLTDSTTARFVAQSNGGLANYQSNNVNLSDERTKKDIIPLESYWNKFKAIQIVKFKYKDQTHDDYNIGVIAQQVESVAPEFIDVDGFGETPEDGIPYKTVYTSDLHHATIKVLQEAMAKIEELNQKVTALENK